MTQERKIEDDKLIISNTATAVVKEYSLEFAQWQLDNINREIQEYEDRVIDAKERRIYRKAIVDHVAPIIEAKKEEERPTEEAKLESLAE